MSHSELLSIENEQGKCGPSLEDRRDWTGQIPDGQDGGELNSRQLPTRNIQWKAYYSLVNSQTHIKNTQTHLIILCVVTYLQNLAPLMSFS